MLQLVEYVPTLSIPNIFGLLSEINDMSKSMMDTITSNPSIMFHPDLKYGSVP